MLILTVLGMAALLAISYIASKTLLFPPALFAGVWLVSLLGLFIADDLFFSISGTTYLVFLVGASAFFCGGTTALFLDQLMPNRIGTRRASARDPIAIYLALDVFFLATLIGLPFYWQQIGKIAGELGDDFILQNVRMALVERSNESAPLGLVGNFAVLAQFVALAMFYEMDGTWKRAIRMLAAVALSLVYGFLSGTKGGAVILFLTIFFVSWIKYGQLRIARMLLTLGLSVLVFGVGILFVNLVYLPMSDFKVTISILGESILNYWLGGLVGFDRIVENPNVMESAHPVNRFFLETARSLGWSGYVPNLHADFSLVGPSLESNTYTIYFTYFKEFGWVGTVILMFAIGGLLTCLQLQSKNGGPKAVIFYAMMCAAITLSFQVEHFFLGLNGYLKAFVFFYFLFNIVPFVTVEFRRRALSHA